MFSDSKHYNWAPEVEGLDVGKLINKIDKNQKGLDSMIKNTWKCVTRQFITLGLNSAQTNIDFT